MNKHEVIEFLDKKREQSLGNIAYFSETASSKNQEAMDRVRLDVYTIAIQAVERIEEPQPDKVEVPSGMGIFLDHYPDKEETAMHIVMHDFTESEYFSEFAKVPRSSYPMGWDRLMASALMFGYTVKPKRWVVKLPNDYYFSSWVSLYSLESDGVAYKFYDDVFVFDDRTKAEAVATLVEGSVEEV